MADPDDLQTASLGRLADGSDLHEWAFRDRIQPMLQVGEAIGLDAGDVKLGAGHRDSQPHAVAGEPLQRDRLPRLPIRGDDGDLQLVRDRRLAAVPDVVQVPELQGERGARLRVDPEVEVARGAVRRGPLVVVEQVHEDGAVGRGLVPERRGVLETGVDVLEPGPRGWRGAVGIGLPADASDVGAVADEEPEGRRLIRRGLDRQQEPCDEAPGPQGTQSLFQKGRRL